MVFQLASVVTMGEVIEELYLETEVIFQNLDALAILAHISHY
jgi:hypothetical protein